MAVKRSGIRHLDDSQLTALLSSDQWGTALSILWDRHAGLLYSTARTVCRSDDDARDAMSEALSKIAQRAAGGHLSVDLSFKSYAAMAVRNACTDMWRRTGRVEPTADHDLETPSGGASFLPDPVVDGLEEKFIASAFAALPENYRRVLWLVEVEGMPPREVADLLSMSANNVSQIAVRARASLREAWASAHLARLDPSSSCHEYAQLLPALAAGTLKAAHVEPLHAHLAHCAPCSDLHRELMNDTAKLRGLALPIPAALLFRKLRGGIGTVSATAESGTLVSSLVSRTTSGLQKFAETIRVVAANGSHTAAVGAVAVTAIATVSFGTYAVTNLVQDAKRKETTQNAEIAPANTESSQSESGSVSATTPSSSSVNDQPSIDKTTTPPSTSPAPQTTRPSDTTRPPVATPVPSSPTTEQRVLPPIDGGSVTWFDICFPGIATAELVNASIFESESVEIFAGSIWDGISSEPDFELFADLILIAGRAPLLDAIGPGSPMYTVFAATNAAIENLLDVMNIRVADLPPSVARAILADHISNGSISPSQFANETFSNVAMSSGYTVEVTRNIDGLFDVQLDGRTMLSQAGYDNGFLYGIPRRLNSTAVCP